MITVSLGTRLAVILADVIVLATTWHKTMGTVRQAAHHRIQIPLSVILIRDGTFSNDTLTAVWPTSRHPEAHTTTSYTQDLASNERWRGIWRERLVQVEEDSRRKS